MFSIIKNDDQIAMQYLLRKTALVDLYLEGKEI